MIRVASRLLMLFACGLTVPPPCWCCAAAKALTPAAPVPKPAEPPPCCGCCCPPEPAPVPDAPPAPPARAWCCEREPAAAPRAIDVESPDLVSFDLPTTPAVPALRICVAAADVVVPDDPLHILHCVWRC